MSDTLPFKMLISIFYYYFQGDVLENIRFDILDFVYESLKSEIYIQYSVRILRTLEIDVVGRYREIKADVEIEVKVEVKADVRHILRS